MSTLHINTESPLISITSSTTNSLSPTLGSNLTAIPSTRPLLGSPDNNGSCQTLFAPGAKRSLVGRCIRLLPDYPQEGHGVDRLQVWAGRMIRDAWRGAVADTQRSFTTTKRAGPGKQPSQPKDPSLNPTLTDTLEKVTSNAWYKTTFPTPVVLHSEHGISITTPRSTPKGTVPLQLLKRGDKIIINGVPQFYLRTSTREGSPLFGVETLDPLTLEENITFVESSEQVFIQAHVTYAVYTVFSCTAYTDYMLLKCSASGSSVMTSLYLFVAKSFFQEEFIRDMQSDRGYIKVYVMVLDDFPQKAVVLGWISTASCHLNRAAGLGFGVQDGPRVPRLRRFCVGQRNVEKIKVEEKDLKIVTDDYDGGICLQCRGTR